MTADFPVFVIHYRGAPERRRFQTQQLWAAGFRNVTFAETFDRRSMTGETVARLYDPSPEKWRAMTAAMRAVLVENGQFHPGKKSWSQDVNYDVPDPPFRRLRPAEIAVTAEHLALYAAIAEQGIDKALVLEDDAVISRDFAPRLARNLAATPDDWDFVFMGSCCNLRVPHRQPGVAVYAMHPPRSKCVDSYLIRGRAARAVHQAALPFVQPIDWELGYWMDRLGCKTYWWEPPLVVQGSQIGLFTSATS